MFAFYEKLSRAHFSVQEAYVVSVTEDEFMSLKPGDMVRDDSEYGISWIALGFPNVATGIVKVLVVDIIFVYYESVYPVGSVQFFGSNYHMVLRPTAKIVRSTS